MDKCVLFSAVRVIDQDGPVDTLEDEKATRGGPDDSEGLDQGFDVLKRTRAAQDRER